MYPAFRLRACSSAAGDIPDPRLYATPQPPQRVSKHGSRGRRGATFGVYAKLEDSQSAPYAAFEPDAPPSTTLPSRNYDDNFYSQPSPGLRMDAVTGGLDVPALAKGLNLLASILCVACAIAFMSEEGSYLSVIIGLETAFFCGSSSVRRAPIRSAPVHTAVRRALCHDAERRGLCGGARRALPLRDGDFWRRDGHYITLHARAERLRGRD